MTDAHSTGVIESLVDGFGCSVDKASDMVF